MPDDKRYLISRETGLQLGLVISIVTGCMVLTWNARGLIEAMRRVEVRVAGFESTVTGLESRFTNFTSRTDIVTNERLRAWGVWLKRQNPDLSVPDPTNDYSPLPTDPIRLIPSRGNP